MGPIVLAVPVQLLIVLVTSVAVAAFAVPLAATVGAGAGLIDLPRPGELQRRPIGRAGGYGIVAAFFAAVVATLPFADRINLAEYTRLAGFAFGAALLVLFAAWDDARRLHPGPQLIGQLSVAAIPLLFGTRLESVASPFGGQIVLPALLVIPATLLWIVGMINTVNWIDTMDGLAGGVAMISAFVLCAASLTLGQHTIALLPLALGGACLGFLLYNFPPARIFMGTGGSMFLGYALGVLSIIGGAKIATAALVLGIPILDTALVIIARLAGGRSPLRGGDGRHLVHRLRLAGLSARRVTLLLYALTALFGSLSLFLVKVQKFYAFAAMVGAVTLLFLFLRQRGVLVREEAPTTE